MLASALVEAATGPEIDRAATAAGITSEQLRRALRAFGSVFPEPAVDRSAAAPWWML